MEQHKRTLCKTITWRLIALAITIIVVYVFSGDAQKSFSIGITANLIKMGVYYVHERIWNRIHFGRAQEPEYYI